MVVILFGICAEEADCEPLALEKLMFESGVGTDAIPLRKEWLQPVKRVQNVQWFFLSCPHCIRVAYETAVPGGSLGHLRSNGSVATNSRHIPVEKLAKRSNSEMTIPRWPETSTLEEYWTVTRMLWSGRSNGSANCQSMKTGEGILPGRRMKAP